MQLVNKDWGNWADIRRQFTWQVPPSFNIGYVVCDRHTSRQRQVALWYENSQGETSSFTL